MCVYVYVKFKRNHATTRDDGIEAEVLSLQMELEEALKINQCRAHVLGSQNEELIVRLVYY